MKSVECKVAATAAKEVFRLRLRHPGADTRNFNRRDCPPDRSLVSVDLRTDEIPSTGGHRFFAPFSTEKEPLALSPGVPNPKMTMWGALDYS